MRCVLVNGSPRGEKSNSRTLLGWLAQGLAEHPDIVNLVPAVNIPAVVRAALDADLTVVAFPLYTDSIPGIVKAFFEEMYVDKDKFVGKKFAFIVQSGFPEAIHTEFLVSYLERFTGLLGAKFGGVLRMGNGEGLRQSDDNRENSRRDIVIAQGKELSKSGVFDQVQAAPLLRPRRFSPLLALMFLVLKVFGLFDAGWNAELKKNGAFEKRRDRPFLPKKAE